METKAGFEDFAGDHILAAQKDLPPHRPKPVAQQNTGHGHDGRTSQGPAERASKLAIANRLRCNSVEGAAQVRLRDAEADQADKIVEMLETFE